MYWILNFSCNKIIYQTTGQLVTVIKCNKILTKFRVHGYYNKNPIKRQVFKCLETSKLDK